MRWLPCSSRGCGRGAVGGRKALEPLLVGAIPASGLRFLCSRCKRPQFITVAEFLLRPEITLEQLETDPAFLPFRGMAAAGRAEQKLEDLHTLALAEDGFEHTPKT